MILLCGIPSETPVRLVAEAAAARGIPYLVFNQREARYGDCLLRLSDGQVDGWLELSGRRYALSDFAGVYVRIMDPRDLPEARRRGQHRLSAEQLKSTMLHEMLQQWLEIAPCLVMNRNAPSASNMSKPYQAQTIARTGLRVPATLVTNEPSEALAFAARHGRVVYKSISSVRSIVRELESASRRRLERIRNLPTQFQAFVPGTNVRVHVAGDQVFATQIRSTAVDYRYAGRDGLDVEMEALELPDEIAARCLTLAQVLGLPLCGIDLKRTPDGDYYCFEVNPSPAFSYYQEQTGQPIADAVATCLMDGRPAARAPCAIGVS